MEQARGRDKREGEMESKRKTVKIDDARSKSKQHLNSSCNSSMVVHGSQLPHSPTVTSVTPINARQSTSSSARVKRRVLPVGDLVSPKRLKHTAELEVHVLLPNATSVKFDLDDASVVSPAKLLDNVRILADQQASEDMGSSSKKRTVRWGPNVWLEDTIGTKLDTQSSLVNVVSSAKSIGTLRLILFDGDKNFLYTDGQMWDVTPQPSVLVQSPHGYTIQTALADQVDNALQAVWHNKRGDRRLVSVTLDPDKIVIFDTGLGMDGSPGNCISTWGTMGGSMHREVHQQAVGGEPPFLKPYLGKYGAGGVAAALHLGRSVTVWSKTKNSKLVWSLVLRQEELEDKNESVNAWKTQGACRAVTNEELELSPHRSFTRVEITHLKNQYCLSEEKQYWRVNEVKCLLKDIYFPYVQSERGSSSRIVCPVEFEVNRENLLEIADCETAISKMHSCNGDPFVLDLAMRRPRDNFGRTESGDLAHADDQEMEEANARITCHYYPNQRGKEALETVIEEGKKLRPQEAVSFDSYSRVSIRWLGRLLPEVKWPIFPFMEITARREQKIGVKRAWSRRVKAFVDTDAGFHPNQSKIELVKDQPFVVALKGFGKDDFAGTSAADVTPVVKHKGQILKTSQVTEKFLEWLKLMHSTFDEEFVFLDEAIYIFNHPNALKELGVDKTVIIFQRHMKDGTGEFKVDSRNPLRLRVPKGCQGLKSDKYVTVEYFFHDGAEDEPGEVKFLCRGIDVDDAAGCKIFRRGENQHFALNKSSWFPASHISTMKRVDDGTWKKKLEELMNKSPSDVQVLNEDDANNLQRPQSFSVDKREFEAGFRLPKEIVVVIRPQKGSGPTFKQGMIVAEPMDVYMSLLHCKCVKFCPKQKLLECSQSLPPEDDEHFRLVSKFPSQSEVSKTGVKGLYAFRIGSSEVNSLTKLGIYHFIFSVESEKYKDIKPATLHVRIHAGIKTSKWTLCSHAEGCALADHSREQQLASRIKLCEPFTGTLFVQKYDEYDNLQTFEKPMALEAVVVTPTGRTLGMVTKILAEVGGSASQGKFRLQVSGLIFGSGSLKPLENGRGLLRVLFPNGQHAEIFCTVSPGPVASIRIKGSDPLIVDDRMQFQEALRPGEIINQLDLQGLDAYGNRVEKGEKLFVELDGLNFQGSSVHWREVNDDGCLQLGGLLKVNCVYNSKGSVTLLSTKKVKLCSISFETVTRRLRVTGVPAEGFLGRQVAGVRIQMVDENGQKDDEIDGFSHLITLDWLKGVAYPFARGECVLPGFRLPEKPGPWSGLVYFSTDRDLCATIEVNVRLDTARSLRTVKMDSLTAICGKVLKVPFVVLDEHKQPARLTENMMQSIQAKVEGKDESQPIFKPCTVEFKDVKKSRMHDNSDYEARVVLNGPVGAYTITLMDTSFELEGKVELTCILLHGDIVQLSPSEGDGSSIRSRFKSFSELKVKRRRRMPPLTVSLLDCGDNLCTSCEDLTLNLKLAPDCHSWTGLATKVAKGKGTFDTPFSVDVPVGTYQAVIELEGPPDDMYCLERQFPSLKCSFQLKVEHGNYPSALELPYPAALHVPLTGELPQLLGPICVLVKSADRKKLRDLPDVGVRVLADTLHEYSGKHVEDGETESAQYPETSREASYTGSACSARYEFTQVCVPSRVGEYVMEYYVRGQDEVASKRQLLIIRHGPPAKIEILQRQLGEALDVLQVQLTDSFGNVCDSINGLEICLDLSLDTKDTRDKQRTPCSLQSHHTAAVKQGKANFGPFAVSEGMAGLYALKIFTKTVAFKGHVSPSIMSEVQLFICRGDLSENVSQVCSEKRRKARDNEECVEKISMGNKQLHDRKTRHGQLRQSIRKLDEEHKILVGRWNALERVREDHHDDRLLHPEETKLPRTEGNVENDIISWTNAGNCAAAFAFLHARSGSNFLSPQSHEPAAQDVIGLVAMLARVESQKLNEILAEYLGVGTLVTIVCRTEEGMQALERYTEGGDPDFQRGLHAVARSQGKRIVGRYEVLAVNEIPSYFKTGGNPVNLDHPQRLLNIDNPRLRRGEVPNGFLGYAVNLLHLSEANLEMQVMTRDRNRGLVGLRESLFFHLLRYLQVYDTRDNMNFASRHSRDFGAAISLDGGIIRSNKRHSLGKSRNAMPISFSLVPYEQRITVSLLPPLCGAFERLLQSRHILAAMRDKIDQLKELNEQQTLNDEAIQKLEDIVDKARTAEDKLITESQSINLQIETLSKAAKANADTPGDGLNSQSRDRRKSRAFIIKECLLVEPASIDVYGGCIGSN